MTADPQQQHLEYNFDGIVGPTHNYGGLSVGNIASMAVAMMSGVSLSNEKSYLVGKFARLALQTANLDYNGRFCMVSAGAGNKKAQPPCPCRSTAPQA